MGTTVCNEINSFTDDLNNFEVRLKSCKVFFNTHYTIDEIKKQLGTKLKTEKDFYNIINKWTHEKYDELFGNDYDKLEKDVNLNNLNNLNKLEEDIDKKIKDNNDIIKKIKDISGSRNEYKKFNRLLEDAQNTGDASEPRKKVRKQLLQNKNLLAFIYLSAILGGSYYIYRYLKK